MVFEKMNDNLYIDSKIISIIFIKPNKFFNEELKEVKESFQIFGITNNGYEIPVSLFEAETYEEIEEWIKAYFIK